MLRATEGVYQDGKVVLREPASCEDGTEVVVVFLEHQDRQGNLLSAKGISPEQAADLRWRLRAFEADWNAPGMEAYDEL